MEKLDFGVEEFAVALNLFKKQAEANGLLISTFGKMSQEEQRGRMLAAYNSLFARGLLTYAQQESTLQPEIVKLLNIFFTSHKLIKVGKAVNSAEDVISYYAYQNVWLEHSVTQGVAHRFRYPIKEKAILDNISEFLSPTGLSNVISTCVNIPAELILNSPPGTLSDYDTVLAILGKNISKITPEIKQLSEDIAKGKWRGSTIWMNRIDEDRLLSRGYLWVQGQNRLWAINSKNSDESVFLRATLCSKADFDSKLQELIFTEAV